MIVFGLPFVMALHGCEEKPNQSENGPRLEVASQPVSSTQPASQVVFDTLSVDLGQRYASSEPFFARFPFKNTGKSPVTLLVVACCGSQAQFVNEKSTYYPGESGEILFELLPRPHEVEATQTATVEQIGVDVPIAELKVVATIKRHFRITPWVVAFGRVLPGQIVEAEVMIEPGSVEEHGEILGFEIDSPLLKVEQVATTQPMAEKIARIWKYLVRLTGDGLTRRFESNIVFKSSISDQPEVVVPVYADFPGRIELVPPRLYFGQVAPGTIVGKNLNVIINDQKFAGEITVRPGQGNVTLKNKKSDKMDRQTELYFELNVPMDAKGILQGEIHITYRGLFDTTVPWTAFVHTATNVR